jgi:cation diffusion facilitator family transporter
MFSLNGVGTATSQTIEADRSPDGGVKQSMSTQLAARTSVYAALASNLSIAIVKFAAAAVTGSSAMLSEGVHSLVDTTNELLILYGIKRAARPADTNHPLGHGRELYFWSFIVAVQVLVVGAAVAGYQGVIHLLYPEPFRNPLVNYVVLGASFVFEGVSWWFGLKAFRATKGLQTYAEAFRSSKDPTTFLVVFEDTAALLGLLIAAAGIAAAQAFDAPRLDGVASIGIALVLLVSSLLLVRETKGLLIGETAHARTREDILRVAGDDPGVRRANGVLALQLGPNQVVAALSVEFHEALSTKEIEQAVNRIETAVCRASPDVVILFVKPQTAATWRSRAERVTSVPDDSAE